MVALRGLKALGLPLTRFVNTLRKRREGFVENNKTDMHERAISWIDDKKSATRRIDANTVTSRWASQGIPGHRAPSAHRDKPDTQTLPHANICSQHSRGKVPILVLSYEVEESQEVEWRGYQHQRGMRIQGF